MILAGEERNCLDYIAGKIRAEGIAPSLREIKAALKLSGTSAAWRLLDQLERKKKIRRLWHKSRALELTPSSKSEYGFVPLVAYPSPPARYFKAVRESERTVLTEIQWTCTIPQKPEPSSTSLSEA